MPGLKDIKFPEKDLIDATSAEAQKFFLRSANYFKSELPKYFDFSGVLNKINSFYEKNSDKELGKVLVQIAKNTENINHRIYFYKSKNVLRPISFLNPVIYVLLVRLITEKENWDTITDKFREFRKVKFREGKLRKVNKITCASTFTYSAILKKKPSGLQISTWIKKVEKESIKLSLEYQYVFNTDIANFYPSIYTHSIEWALHNKEESKKKLQDKDKEESRKPSLGAEIDKYIRALQYGQTNGIPQGSVLMDFIAEMVLGYIDTLLEEKLEKLKEKKELDNDYTIIRYRDDYRIFVNKQFHGQLILKTLTSTLLEFGMSLKEEKTDNHNIEKLILTNPVKDAKLEYIMRRNMGKNLYEKLLILHQLVKKYPRENTLATPLSNLIKKYKKININTENVKIYTSLLSDICILNPDLLSISISFMSTLIIGLKKDEQIEIIDDIIRKFNSMPETGFLEIWLQRLSYPVIKEKEYKEKLCKTVMDSSEVIWDLEWLKKINNEIYKNKIYKIVSTEPIVDKKILEKTKLPFDESEASPFSY